MFFVQSWEKLTNNTSCMSGICPRQATNYGCIRHILHHFHFFLTCSTLFGTNLEMTCKWRAIFLTIVMSNLFKPFQYTFFLWQSNLFVLPITRNFYTKQLWESYVFHSKRLAELSLQYINFTSIMTHNQRIVNLMKEDNKIIIRNFFNECTVIRNGHDVIMIQHKEIEVLISLPWCLLEIQALLLNFHARFFFFYLFL